MLKTVNALLRFVPVARSAAFDGKVGQPVLQLRPAFRSRPGLACNPGGQNLPRHQSARVFAPVRAMVRPVPDSPSAASNIG